MIIKKDTLPQIDERSLNQFIDDYITGYISLGHCILCSQLLVAALTDRNWRENG